MSIIGHSISYWLPCPVPSWVSKIIGTWGGNSVIKCIAGRECDRQMAPFVALTRMATVT